MKKDNPYFTRIGTHDGVLLNYLDPNLEQLQLMSKRLPSVLHSKMENSTNAQKVVQ